MRAFVAPLCLLSLLVPLVAVASPPSELVVPDDGGRPQVPGEAPPPRELRLPVLDVASPPTPVSAPALPAEPPTAAVLPTAAVPATAALMPMRVASPPPTDRAIELAVGPMWLPQALFGLFSRFDRHPELVGTGIDVAWHEPLGVQRWLAVRLGVGLPHLQPANWYESGQLDLTNDLWRPVYTNPKITLIDIAAEYLGRTPVVPNRLDWTWRAGLGATFLAGAVERIDTLPSCTLPERPVCPHWQTVGRLQGGVPVVLPAVRLTTGLALRLGDKLSIGAELGLRGVPWAGVSATFGL